MRSFRLHVTHRFLAALLLLSFALYGVEAEVADVHDGGVEATDGNPAHGTNPKSDSHPAHVCHCSHTHLGVLATAPSLNPAVVPAPKRVWRAPAMPPSVRPLPPLRPPIA